MVHFISFQSTSTVGAPDSNLEEKKNYLNAPAFFQSKNLSKQTMIGMKLQNLFRRKEKLTNDLTINAEAHQVPTARWHCHGHAGCCRQSTVAR